MSRHHDQTLMDGPGTPPEAAPAAGAEPRRYGYRRPADVSGRSAGEAVYWLALVVAAGADMATFHQVVSLVMRKEQGWLIALLVAGLTATALTLAHFAGRLAREVAAGTAGATWRSVAWCATPWLLLGIATVVVRVIVADPGAAIRVNAGSSPAGGGTAQAAGAWLFAALYGASGMIAAITEFFSVNPLRTDYRRALRMYRKAQRRLVRSQPAYQRALHVRELHRSAHVQDEANWRAVRKRQLAYAEELKRYAAVLIAAHLQSPSATDGMTEPDWRPIRPGRSASAPHPAQPDGQPGPAPGGADLPGAPISPHQPGPHAHNHSKVG